MQETITVRYVVNGTTLVDVVHGTDVQFQMRGRMLDIRFPHKDGKIISSGITSLTGETDLKRITYAESMHAVTI